MRQWMDLFFQQIMKGAEEEVNGKNKPGGKGGFASISIDGQEQQEGQESARAVHAGEQQHLPDSDIAEVLEVAMKNKKWSDQKNIQGVCPEEFLH